MRSLSCLCLLLLAASAIAADAPTEAEWAPIEAKIAAGDRAARSDLARLMAGRTWPEGWVKLADLDRAAGDHQATFTHARTAVQQLGEPDANPRRQAVAANAHWLAIHAANQLARPEVGLKVFEAFGQRADPRGEVHYRAAESALLTGDAARADQLLARAKQLASDAGGSVPLGFRFLEARIYEARAAAADSGSETAIAALEAAAATYRRALGGEPLPGAWFNLARMQRQLARQIPTKRDEYLAQAGESLREVLALDEDDADARFLLGLVRLEQGEEVSAYNAFNTALKHYLAADATADTWMVATAYRGRGTALLQMAEIDPDNWSHVDALADLERARQMGESSADLYNNLLVAYLALQRRAGGADPGLAGKISAILSEHGDAITPTNLALSFFHQAAAAVGSEDRARLEEGFAAADSATDLLLTALGAGEDPASWDDPQRERAALWRYLGHGYRVESQLAAALGAAAGRQTDADEAMDRAYAAWRVAGGLGDLQAQRHYLAWAAHGDPLDAYAAAWDVLGWQNLLSLEAWRLAIANYGASGRWRDPVHLGAWGLLLVLLLALGIRGRFAGRREEVVTAEQRRAAAGPKPKPDPQAADRAADETFLPDSLQRPRKRDPALTTNAESGIRSVDRIPDDAPADESYLPTTLPPKSTRGAVSDVAKRLARERDQGGDQPRPRRRR